AGLVLRPPVPGAHAAERRKTPSLFERITGVHRQDEQGGEGGQQQGSGGGGVHGLTARRAPDRPAQGSLNIDSPAAPPRQRQSEDELDIPAFLRRQAN